MAAHEAIFRGTPAEFGVAAEAFSARIRLSGGERLWTYHWRNSGFTPNPAANPVIVIMAEGHCEIMAHALSDRRSHLFWQRKEPSSPEIESWQALLGELRRLGYIEAGEAELVVATEAAEPPKRKGGGKRSDYTEQERREACEEYRALGGGMTQDQFMAERYGGMKGRTLRDWLSEFGL